MLFSKSLYKADSNNISLLSRILRGVLVSVIAAMAISILIVLIVEDYWSLYHEVYAIFIYGSIIYAIYALFFSFLAIVFLAIKAKLAHKNVLDSVRCEALLLTGGFLGIFILHVLILSGH